MDFVQGLDPSKLVIVEIGLSFFLSISSAPAYNLPIFLFGAYAQENSEAIQSLKLFTGLLGASLLWDIIWIFKHPADRLVKIIFFVLVVLKIPTFMAFAATMRQRGAHFSGVGLGGGETVWSMPGGFTSGGGDGYTAVNDGPTPNPQQHKATAPAPAPAAPAVPGGYQSV